MAIKVDSSEVQGNILKAFHKRHVWMLFFQYGNKPNDPRRWLAGIAKGGKIPSTDELTINSGEKRNTPYRSPNKTYLHVSLTAKGISKLDVPLPPSKGVYGGKGKRSRISLPTGVKDDPFANGMKSRANILGDTGESHYSKWLEPYRSQEIDALVMVASDTVGDAEKEYNNLKRTASAYFEINVVHIEKGSAIYDDASKERKDRRMEHFGFQDGISQPLIKGVDDAKIRKRMVYKDAFDPEDFVLFGLTGKLEWANNGSFLTFRRLRQDVHGFHNFIAKSCAQLNMSREEMLAKFMGRYRDGRPLDKYSRAATYSVRDYNDFNYRPDPAGTVTPLFSHIRKTNTRTSAYSKDMDMHRILRRGITYGEKAKEVPDRVDRGLLFMCYQRDLEMQFEYVQHALANDPNFPSPRVGHDPVIGRPTPGGQGFVSIASHKIGLNQWVTMTGGDYFFSPSIPALMNL